MPDLLFISDNPKVEQVRDLLQPMLKIDIDVTAVVEYAVEDVLNNPPSVICIQEQVAGTTAGEIAGRILAVPDNGTPVFVLLREGNDTALPPEQIFKHVADLSLPVEQLVKSILRAVLQPAFKLRQSEVSVTDKQEWPTTSLKAGKVPDELPAAMTKSQIPSELLKAFEQNYRSRRRGRWMKCAAVSLAACLALFAWRLTSPGHDRGGAISRTLPVRPTTEQPMVAPVPPVQKSTPGPAPSSAIIAQKAPAAAPVSPAQKSTPAPAPSSAAIVKKAPAAPPVPPVKKSTPSPVPSSSVIAQKAPAATPVSPAQKSTHAPAPSSAVIAQKAPAPPQPAADTVAASKLPSFIPKKGRDSAYSRQKPGWERYTDATHEFRILRSGKRIKTIQVLAATPDAISKSFMNSVLAEISGSKSYQETSQEEEHGFLVKRGSAGPGVKILIYTQESRIRAFVISRS